MRRGLKGVKKSYLCEPLRPLRLCGKNQVNRRGAEDAEVRRGMFPDYD